MMSSLSRMSLLEARHLQAFLVAAEERHFGRAAARLGITQPTLSKLIAKLEEVAGEALLVRRPAVRLTEAGQALFGHAQRSIEELQQGLSSVAKVSRGITGLLAVGFPSWLHGSFVPTFVRHFRTRYPEIDLRLRGLNSATQLTELARGALQVGFVREQEVGPELKLEPLYEENWVLAVAENHPLAPRVSVTPGELDGVDLIGFPRVIAPSAHDSVFGMLHRAGARPAIVQEVDNWPAAVALAAAGVGSTIVPSSLCSSWTPGMRYVPIDDPANHVTVFICTKAAPDAPTKAFVQALKLFGADAAQSKLK